MLFKRHRDDEWFDEIRIETFERNGDHLVKRDLVFELDRDELDREIG